MSNHFYADGSTHNDHHKEINIGGNLTPDALRRLTQEFFSANDADKLNVEDISVDEDESRDVQVCPAEEVVCPPAEAESSATSVKPGELFRYIHPEIIDDDKMLVIHQQIVNLVGRFPVQDICDFLLAMERDKKVLLPISPRYVLAELQRLGLPGEEEEGFSYKNFCKYYKR